MSAPAIHPILLMDIVSHPIDECFHQHLQAIEQDPASNVLVQRLEDRLILAAEDELQVEAACERLRQAGPIQFGTLRIAYRETIRKTAEAEGKYIRQTGGAGNYGHCWLRIEPNTTGAGYQFQNAIRSESLPPQYLEPVEDGIQYAMESGILAGYPMTDVKVTLFESSYHETDSNEMAFKFAASIAFKEAARKASPVLLEPVMAVEIEVPEQLNGAVVHDINLRRGRIHKIDSADGWCEVGALIPLAEILRSSPHGRPDYPMHFVGYQEVPRPNDRSDGDVMMPVIRPQRPGPDRSSAPEPDRDE